MVDEPELGLFLIRVAAGKRCLFCWLLSNHMQTTSSPSTSATVMTGLPDFNLTVSPTANVDIRSDFMNEKLGYAYRGTSRDGACHGFTGDKLVVGVLPRNGAACILGLRLGHRIT